MTKMPGSCPFNFHLMDSCLKFRKQSVRTNNTYSSFLELTSGVLQSTVMGALLFYIFVNYLFLFINMHHFMIMQTVIRYQLIHLILTRYFTFLLWSSKPP